MKESILKSLRQATATFLMMTLICGVGYTFAVTGIAKVAFPKQAEGSLVTETNGEKPYGSALIGQSFTKPEYLIGRPMGTSNLSPVSKEQAEKVNERIAWWRAFDPEAKGDIPMDLVTGSGSGVDPNISPEAAAFQVKRIAKARHMAEADVQSIIEANTTQQLLGFIGEPAVNVLKVNLALDQVSKK